MNPLESLSYISVVPELMITRGFDPPPPPPLPPPDPPPAAAPNPRTLAIVTPVIPNAGTASAAVSDGEVVATLSERILGRVAAQDIKNLTDELNIYESIYKNAVTGTVVIADAKNQIGRLEVQGLERIAFKLSSPGTNQASDQVDASVETGEPFHVYKITDRKQVNQGLLVYTLHFASREFMRNLRTKVSQAYNGRLDMAVQKILQDENYLDTRKRLKYEKTGNRDKIVIPNLRPFDAIQMIADKAIPEKSDAGVGSVSYTHLRAHETPEHLVFRVVL